MSVEERLSQLEKDVRERWFKDHVAAHQIVHCADGTLIERLRWKKPGTGTYLVEYLRIGGRLIVTGDIGDAIYWWSGNHSMHWISNCNLGYFAGKCEASENGRDFKVWDSDVARDRILAHFEEVHEWADTEDSTKAEEMKKKFEENHGWSAIHDQYEWVAWIREYGQEVFGDDWWESSISDPGRTLNIRCYGHLLGLKMAFEQIGEDPTKLQGPFDGHEDKPEPEAEKIPWWRKLLGLYSGDVVVQKNIHVTGGNIAGGDINVRSK